MPESSTLLLFLSATFILSITPGPGILYVLARTLDGGRNAGILSSLGTLVGGMFHVVAAAVGVSSLLMTSAIAFSIVKYVGAAYLIYLGLHTLLHRDSPASASATPTDPIASSVRNVFYQGILTEILNPKTALFFLAFIPQFVSPDQGSILTQFLILGSITTLLNTLVDIGVAIGASSIRQWVGPGSRFQRRQRTFSGCTLISLGTYVAVTDSQ